MNVKLNDSQKRNYIDAYVYREFNTIKFTEQYYLKEMQKRDNKIKKLNIYMADSSSSYCAKTDSEYNIGISYNNLMSMFDSKNKSNGIVNFHIAFYSIMIHEIGHALHTNMNLYQSYNLNIQKQNILNVMEDNRIERIMEISNKRTRFDLIKKMIIDDSLSTIDLMNMNTPNAVQVALYLMRGFDKQRYIKRWGLNDKLKKLIKELLEMDVKYTAYDTEYKISDIDEVFNKSYEIAKELRDLSDIKDDEEEDMLDDEEQAEKIEEEENEFLDFLKMLGEALGENYIPTQEEVSDMEELLDRLVFDVNGSGNLDIDYNVRNLTDKNTYYIKDDYEPFNISLQDYERQKGIRGTGTSKRVSGNVKQLNMRSYMAREHTKETKHFDKDLKEDVGKYGKEIDFYMDFSGSMYYERLTMMVDYVKNFYDKYHNTFKINLRAFGSGQLILKREHLELRFIKTNDAIYDIGNSTQIMDFDFKGTAIVLTDGFFDFGSSFEKLKKDAIFIIVHTDEQSKKRFEEKYKDVKNKIFVNERNIKEGYEKATQGLRRLL